MAYFKLYEGNFMIVQRMCKNLENQGNFPIINDKNESERLDILDFTVRPVNKYVHDSEYNQAIKIARGGLQRLGFRS
tara:strand:- start:277 stop:507 length:231 start_codon:yes stop_codon:yes gene_type:complete